MPTERERIEALECAVAELAHEMMLLRMDLCAAIEGIDDESTVPPNCSDAVQTLAGPVLDRLEAVSA